MAASRAIAIKSAPTKPCESLAYSSKSTLSSRGIPRVWICKISFLPSASGTGNSISRSKRPGLLNASSIELILLVAPITIILPRPFNPSKRLNN